MSECHITTRLDQEASWGLEGESTREKDEVGLPG